MTNKYQKMLFGKKIFSKVIENKWKLAGVVFLVFVLMFLLKMPRTIVGYGDSDMFITAGYKLGLMKSPGYPIYSALLFLFTHLPFVPNPAMGAHLLSAVFGALTLVFVFLTSWQFYEDKSSKKYVIFSKEIERVLLALSGVCVLGFSTLFWSSSMIAEKYAFGGLVLSAFVWLSTLKVRDKKMISYRLSALSVLLGIGLTHQLVFVALIPVYVFALYKVYGKKELSKIGKYVVMTLATMSVSVALIWMMAQNKMNMAPIMGEGFAGLWDYLSLGYLTNGTGEVSLPDYFSLSNVVVNVWEFVFYVMNDVFWVTLLPFVFLALYIQKTKKYESSFLISGLTLVSFTIWTACIVLWPETSLHKQNVSLQLVYIQIVAAIVSWFGFAEMIGRFGEAGTILFKKKKVDWFNVFLVFLPLLLLATFVLGKQSLSGYNVAYRLNKESLSSVEKNSMITCYSYSSCQSLLYLQEVERLRDDVVVVPFYYQPGLFQINNNELQGFGYKTFPLVMYDVVTWNLKDRNVYAVDIFQEYYDLFGTNFGFMYVVPDGYMGKFGHDVPEKIDSYEFTLSEEIINGGKNDWKLLTDNITAAVARRHVLNASVFMKMGMRKEGTKQANLASNMYHLIGKEEAVEVLAVKERLEKTVESKYYVPGTKAQSVDYIVDNIQPLLDVKLIGRALEVAQGAVTIDPRNVRARLSWADMLLMAKYNDRAIEEYKNVLKLDPGNKEANEGIVKASGVVGEEEKPALFN